MQCKNEPHFDMISTDSKATDSRILKPFCCYWRNLLLGSFDLAMSIILQHEAAPHKIEVQQEQSVGKKYLIQKQTANYNIKLKTSVYPLEVGKKLGIDFFSSTLFLYLISLKIC